MTFTRSYGIKEANRALLQNARVWFALCLAIIGLVTTMPAQAQLRVDISGTGAQQYPVAIADFSGDSAGAQIAEIIRADLTRSGQFRLISTSGSNLTVDTPIAYDEWRTRGADFIAYGTVVRTPDGRFEVIDTLELHHALAISWGNLDGADQGEINASRLEFNGYSRSPKQIDGVRCFAGAEQLGDFLQASRILVNLMPLTPETENILNQASLSKLQAGGYLINVARGRHLVEEDLIALLDSGHLAGAMLDVFRTEPLPAGHPFWQHPKITVTPHTSARTLRDESITQIAGKILALQRGEPIRGEVDHQRGY